MRRMELWDASRIFLGEPESDSTYRISPFIIRADIDVLLRRRQRLFSTMSFAQERDDLWMAKTTVDIPATTVRSGRTIEASFAIVDLGDGVGAFVSSGDSSTYSHSVGKLEDSIYPFAIRPSIRLDAISEVLSGIAEDKDSRLEVMQVRGVSRDPYSKIQLFGRFELKAVFARLRADDAVPQSMRIRGVGTQGEEFRIRIDSGCRLLVERWRLDKSPLDVTKTLANSYILRQAGEGVEYASREDSDGTVLIFPIDGADDPQVLQRLIISLRRLSGVHVFALDSSAKFAVRLIDFIAGVNCLLTVIDSRKLAVQSEKPIHRVFTERLRKILEELQLPTELQGTHG